MTTTKNDEIRIEIANKSHIDGILHLAEYGFNKNEPVAVAMKSSWDEMGPLWKTTIDFAVDADPPCSHVALNSAGKVIGFRLSRILDMSKLKAGDSVVEFFHPGPLRDLHDQVTREWAKVLVDDQGRPCKKLLQFTGLSVDQNYAGRGIGERMCRENLKLGKELGCEYCLVVGSNWRSQRIFEKLGFSMMSTVDYNEYKEHFEITDPKQTTTKSFILKLSNFSE